MVHVSQLSFQRVANASEVLDQNDDVFVKVIGVQPDEGKISLSIRYVNQSTSPPPLVQPPPRD